MAYLELNNITKKYEELVALNNFNFSVEKNEFAVLFGSSAAGKTTTLRCIAGLEQIESGEVFFNENNYTNAPIQGRGMAMVFQTFALYPHLTTEQNLAYPLIKNKIPKNEITKRVAETAEMLRITHALKRKPNTLSGGEQQRLAIGRALIRQPILLLLDEPLANLDAKLRHDTRAELKRLQRDLNMTMVYATPDQLEALTMGDNITIIKEGKFIQKGTPNQLYESPNSRFVADFIGSMNFFEGVVNKQSNGELSVVAETLGEVVVASDQAFSSNAKVWLAIRPEKIKASFNFPNGENNYIEGKMGPSAYLGDRSHCYVTVSDREESILVALQNVEQSSVSLVEENQPVWLEWSKDALVVLSRD